MQAQETILNDRYRLLEQAGSGGMATVYKAHDLTLRRLVAVKVLHQRLTGDDTFLRRFQQEAHAAANLSHPNIVTVHDIGQEETAAGYRHFIVLEYVTGRTLKSLIRQHMEQRGRPLSVEHALELGIQICAGIGYAHRAGLVHCDVKPQNVLVTPDGRVKVADFGIARAMSQASREIADGMSGEQMWGTPHYFSPEQAAGEPATPASDVYAIGIILFEMVTGRLPFEAETTPALALKHMHEEAPLVTEFNPAVPVQLEQIIKKVLSKEPAGRYRTAGQLERILRSYRNSSQEDTGPVFPVHSRPESADGEATRAGRTAPTGEQKTEVFRRRGRAPRPKGDARRRRGPRRRRQRPEVAAEAVHVPAPAPEATTTDWTAVALSLIALVAMLGLIPLWYLVARAWGVW
ncbi:MAG: protein kinase [Candidatus Promineifilaceae bacterium]|nr:protein kinase [Candidatus Promineifilaceae bacterium]